MLDNKKNDLPFDDLKNLKNMSKEERLKFLIEKRAELCHNYCLETYNKIFKQFTISSNDNNSYAADYKNEAHKKIINACELYKINWLIEDLEKK